MSASAAAPACRCRERQREAQADEDDADVLDRAVGEQALEVALHQRVQHAQHRRDAAEQRAPRRPTTRPAAPSRSKTMRTKP